MDTIYDAFSEFADDDAMNYEIFLDSAYDADETGRVRVAVHLFMAAYELAKENGKIPSDEVIDGLRRAWELSLASSDRVSAETIFGALAPFSTREQSKARAKELQKLTVKELESMGIPSERIEGMHRIYNPDATMAGADPEFTNKFQKMMSSDPVDNDDAKSKPKAPRQAPKPPAPSNHPVIDLSNALPIPPQSNSSQLPSTLDRLDYSQLTGFSEAINQMRIYGFDASGDTAYSEFAQRAAEFHGMQGVALGNPFIFSGPSREDTFDFAEATAGEIGYPLLILHTRADEEGLWTVRLSGPLKKGMFGMSDPLDIPVPCIFLIENLDVLQDLVKAAVNGEIDENSGYSTTGPHMASELIGYISTILHKPGVHAMATACENFSLSPQFEPLFEDAHTIKIGYPNSFERYEIWEEFAKSHRSFETVDLKSLTEFSDGISRHDMLIAGLEAVRKAYQISLETQKARYVELSDVLFEMVPRAEREGSSFEAMEDAAAEAFLAGLDGISFVDETAGEEPDSEG